MWTWRGGRGRHRETERRRVEGDRGRQRETEGDRGRYGVQKETGERGREGVVLGGKLGGWLDGGTNWDERE
jgi:hypothetical protein